MNSGAAFMQKLVGHSSHHMQPASPVCNCCYRCICACVVPAACSVLGVISCCYSPLAPSVVSLRLFSQVRQSVPKQAVTLLTDDVTRCGCKGHHVCSAPDGQQRWRLGVKEQTAPSTSSSNTSSTSSCN